MKRNCFLCFLLFSCALAAQRYDLVIANGRVIDPESGLDEIRDVGIRGGSIQAVSRTRLTGNRIIDATSLVVAPGFIDLHWHGVDPASDTYEIMDGVTASFELEAGVADLDGAYAKRAGRSIIHHGFGASHEEARAWVFGKALSGKELAAAVMKREATREEIQQMAGRVDFQLKRGAVAVGLGLAYTPGASYLEALEMFRVAARNHAACHVHFRPPGGPGQSSGGRIQGLSELLAAAAVTGASLQFVHINSSGNQDVGDMLAMIAGARAHGIDVTTEAYPYEAGAAEIQSALFENWENRPDGDFQTLQWGATGERLTRETFLKHRRQGGTVITHNNTIENVRMAILSPLTMIASDGSDVHPGQGHPRSAGTFAKVLATYVREEKSLPLAEAIRKMTWMPAKRVEQRVPAMRKKGRIQMGCDADIAVFDPGTVRDTATYRQPAGYSAGMRYVLVGGVLAVDGGALVKNTFPGKALRAEVAP